MHNFITNKDDDDDYERDHILKPTESDNNIILPEPNTTNSRHNATLLGLWHVLQWGRCLLSAPTTVQCRIHPTTLGLQPIWPVTSHAVLQLGLLQSSVLAQCIHTQCALVPLLSHAVDHH